MAQGWPGYPSPVAVNGAENLALSAENCGISIDPLPPKGPGKRLRLENGGQIRREMTKVYRDMKAGTIDVAKGSKLIYALTELSRAVEREAVERLTERLDKVEGR
jgi:class 3 adenylate cyclase